MSNDQKSYLDIFGKKLAKHHLIGKEGTIIDVDVIIVTAPIPVIVEMNTLDEKNRPKSKDPEFWNIWTGKDRREINWGAIVDEWQRENK